MSSLRALIDAKYPYVVIVASVAMMMIGQGAVFILLVSLKDIAATFDWPRTVPSLAYSMQFIGAGIGGIAMGHILDRSGMAKPALIGAVMVGSGALLVSRVTSPWELYLIYGAMIGFLGQATLVSPLMANITRWFHRRRGAAVGIVSAGQTIAGTVWPPVFSHLVQAVGWREAYVWYGLFALAVMLPLSFVFRREPPKTAPATPTGAPTNGAAPEVEAALVGLSPFMVMVLLSAAVVACCMAMSLPLGHLVAHATDLGHPAARAAEMLAIMLLVATFSRLFAVGWLSDRFGGLGALFAFSALQASTLGLFVLVHDIVGLYLLAAVFGLGYSGIIPCYAIAIRAHLPANEAGRRTAVVILFGGVGMAGGSALGGVMYDLTGSYDAAFLIGVGFNLLNLLIIGFLMRRTGRGALKVEAAA